MSQGLYSITTRASGTTLTAAIYNADHQNHVTNQNPLMTGAYSDNVGQMQTQTNPGGVGTESIAGSLAGELERIRFVIAKIMNTTFWYDFTHRGTGVGHGQCHLDFVSTTQIKLNPRGGSGLRINGQQYDIGTGLTIANTNVLVGGVAAQNLAPSTVYDIYGSDNGSGAVQMEFWASPSGTSIYDTTAGNVGVRVKNNAGSPDSTRTLIGKIKTNGSGQFVNNTFAGGGAGTDNIFILNWFNRTPYSLENKLTATLTGSFLTFGTISNASGTFLTWGDCSVTLNAMCTVSNDTASEGTIIAPGLDSASQGPVAEFINSSGAGQIATLSAPCVRLPSEGSHTFQLMGAAAGGGNSTWYANDGGITLTGLWG